MDLKQSIEEIFKPGGALSQKLKNYEPRQGQVNMASLVLKALSKDTNLIIEAGTGIGKSLAYLIPAVKRKERVIISTGTKNLQEQLFYKDIPFVKNKLGFNFKALLVKGRGNYLCKRRFNEFIISGEFKNKNEIPFFKIISQWNNITKSGDISEAENLPEELSFWSDINARGETCLGTKCPLFEECYITKLRRKAFQSDIIVVNHYLLFADHSVKLSGFGEVLPEYKYLILDEGHLVESIATNYFGSRISDYQVKDLLNDIKKETKKSKLNSDKLQKNLDNLYNSMEVFFSEFSNSSNRYRIDKLKNSKKINEKYFTFKSDIANLNITLKSLIKESEMFEPLFRRTSEIQESVAFIMEDHLAEFVYWAEHTPRTIALYASPLEVNDILNQSFFNNLHSTIITSATLTVGNRFNYIQERIGLDDAKTRIIHSEFDYQAKSLLFLPKALPEPSSPYFYDQMAEEAMKILSITSGNGFMLFTNYRGMEQVYDIFAEKCDFPLFIQGELSKTELLNKFVKTANSVLFATMSFWQGVDIQGDDLKCVIIDKLPFAVPSDPIVSATIDFYNTTGRNGFNEYQLPNAVMLLKQGLGRLIRHKSDYGIAAIMDKRISTKYYGKAFLESIPKFQRINDYNALKDFYNRIVKE